MSPPVHESQDDCKAATISSSATASSGNGQQCSRCVDPNPSNAALDHNHDNLPNNSELLDRVSECHIEIIECPTEKEVKVTNIKPKEMLFESINVHLQEIKYKKLNKILIKGIVHLKKEWALKCSISNSRS